MIKTYKGKVVSVTGHRLSLDTGISGTGVSCWEEKDWEKRVPPAWVRNLYPKAVRNVKQGWIQKATSIMEQLDSIINEWGPIRGIYSEFPELMDGVRGRAASVSKNNLGVKEPGDMLKMLYLVGSVGELCRIYEIPFYYYLPSEWKGQLPKDVVKDRILQRIPTVMNLESPPASHGWDSVGIGLHAKGFMRLC